MLIDATPTPTLLAWVRDNGLDPNEIPLGSPITIEGDRVTVQEYVKGSDGNIVVMHDEALRRSRTVPLLTALPYEVA